MTMEKHGVISSSTPGGCCGGGGCEVNEKTASEKQRILPFPHLEPEAAFEAESQEPVTEKEADSMQDSGLNSAIDAVAKETHGSSN